LVMIKMLNIIGLGLGDPKDITIKGKEAIEKSTHVYLESYTSILTDSNINAIEDFFSKKIIPLSRGDLEDNDKIFENTKNDDVSLLIVGDVFSATTHSEILMRVKEEGIDVNIIHNASIFTAISITGLQLYKFGKTTTIVKPEGSWFPKSPYDIIKQNKEINAHTLCLLDIKIDKNYFMTINEALNLLLEMEKEKGDGIIDDETYVVGVSNLGGDHKIKSGKIKNLIDYDFSKPPHSLIIPNKLHFTEKEVLEFWNTMN
ncbi:MAG: diphthine synthase, partial [Candidatus Woesearchaeota archaeon]